MSSEEEDNEDDLSSNSIDNAKLDIDLSSRIKDLRPEPSRQPLFKKMSIKDLSNSPRKVVDLTFEELNQSMLTSMGF
jgi:hypothetical protein